MLHEIGRDLQYSEKNPDFSKSHFGEKFQKSRRMHSHLKFEKILQCEWGFLDLWISERFTFKNKKKIKGCQKQQKVTCFAGICDVEGF